MDIFIWSFPHMERKSFIIPGEISGPMFQSHWVPPCFCYTSQCVYRMVYIYVYVCIFIYMPMVSHYTLIFGQILIVATAYRAEFRCWEFTEYFKRGCIISILYKIDYQFLLTMELCVFRHIILFKKINWIPSSRILFLYLFVCRYTSKLFLMSL